MAYGLEQEAAEEPSVFSWEMGQQVLGEVTKSYGLGYNKEANEWEFSINVAKKAFEESPVWTSIDWMLAAVPLAKFGTAALKVGLGLSKVGRTALRGSYAVKAYESGKIGFREAVASVARAPRANRFAIPELRAGGNLVESDIALMKEFGEFGYNPHEAKAMMRYFERNAKGAEQILKADQAAIMSDLGLSGLRGAEGKRFADKLLQEGLPDSFRPVTDTADLTGKQVAMGERAYARSLTMRKRLVAFAADAGLISEKQADEFLKTGLPQQAREASLFGPGKGKPRTVIEEAMKGLSQKKRAAILDNPDFDNFMDAALAVDGYSRVGGQIINHNFLRQISDSIVVADKQTLLAKFGSEEALRRNGMTTRVIDLITGSAAQSDRWLKAKRAGDAAKASKLARELKIPKGFEDNLIALEKIVDPNVIDEFGALVGGGAAGTDRLMKGLYRSMLNVFRQSKTSLNPAGHIRNILSGVIFNSYTTGNPFSLPYMGVKAFLKEPNEIAEMTSRGILGDSVGTETVRKITKGLGEAIETNDFETFFTHAYGDRTKGILRRSIEKGANQARDVYHFWDEMWKADGYLKLKRRYLRKGLTAKEAGDRAHMEVMRFQPFMSGMNPSVDALRSHIPFASFTLEAVRTTKNAMIYKPWMVAYWNNFAETASQVFGAMAGFSDEDLANAKRALPDYTEGSPMFVLPFRDAKNRPMFFDLSHIIPMANLGSDFRASSQNFFSAQNLLNPAAHLLSNPVVSLGFATLTGRDPFFGAPVEPKMIEQQLGIPVEGQRSRQAWGYAEYLYRLMLPPLAGYSGVNIAEAVRGQRSGWSGTELEQGVTRTLAATLIGMRTHSPTLGSIAGRVMSEKEREEGGVERVSQRKTEVGAAWDRYEFAKANGYTAAMEEAKRFIISKKGAAWFYENAPRHVPGGFTSLGTTELLEVARRARQQGLGSDLARLYFTVAQRMSR